MIFCGVFNQLIFKVGLKIVENDLREIMFLCFVEFVKLRKKVGLWYYILYDFNYFFLRRCFGDFL